jgi:conjugative transfer region protein TrbK
MSMKHLERLSILAAVALAVLDAAACTIPLRGDADQISPAASADQAVNELATKLAACRLVTPEQTEALSECRKAWAEKRRQFFGDKVPSTSDSSTSQQAPSVFVRPNTDSRLSPGFPVPQSARE